MTPNELRIGCYVKLRDSGERVRVCAITKRKIGFHAPNERPNAQLRYRKYSEIEPVLIRDVKSQLPHIPDLYWADKAMCEDLYYYKDLVITDLHELQNIHFALTGNEIEIEL